MSAISTARGLLERGELRLIGLMPRASNYTFLGEVVEDGTAVRAIYKPREGEVPLWDFPRGTLCQREVAAYTLAEALGWPNVPLTILRDGPHGEGSVQLFVDHVPRENYFTLRDIRERDLRAIAAFDVIAGNGDRKAGHCLLGADERVWAVDHGLCFNEEPVLRTVIWEFAGEPIPGRVIEDVARVETELRDGALHADLAALLTQREIEATAERARRLIETGTYPLPGPGRSEPWPPV